MQERLSLLLKENKMTAVRFAEIMGVQASSISHLLSGRNKPNFDFIVKLLERFPEINPDWFILGKGDMFRVSQRVSTDSTDSSASFFKTDPEFTFAQEQENREPRPENKRGPISMLPKSFSNKTIHQVIILYNDDTFSIYSPSKD